MFRGYTMSVTTNQEQYDLAFAQQMYTSWLTAETKVAAGQSYRIDNRSVTYADLKYIRERQIYWRGECDRLASGRGKGIRVFRAMPRDL